MANEITKKALEQAFLKLLSIKPFKKITVSDVTDLVGVNRMTFYYHFEDIYSLLDYALKTEFNKALDGKYDSTNWVEGFENIFKVCVEYRYLVENAYKFNSRGNVEEALEPIVYQLTYHVVSEEAKGHNVEKKDLEFVANAYKFMLIGIVLDWIKNDMEEDIDTIINKISTMLDGETEWILSKFEKTE